MSENNSIYIGRNAGKYLIKDIYNAKKSVKIISPYLGAEYVKDLIGIKEKGVDVSLITSDNVETKNGIDFDHKDIIIQKQHVNHSALQERKTLYNYLLISLGSMGFSFFLSFFASWYFFNLFILLIISSSIIYYLYIRKVVYTYTYKTLFNLKVFFSQYCNEEQKNDFLIHSKVYIIDDKIAYLGSVNFTFSGIENSYECITKITDEKQIAYLKQEYDNLFYNKRLKSKNINDWGRELYHEPIN